MYSTRYGRRRKLLSLHSVTLFFQEEEEEEEEEGEEEEEAEEEEAEGEEEEEAEEEEVDEGGASPDELCGGALPLQRTSSSKNYAARAHLFYRFGP